MHRAVKTTEICSGDGFTNESGKVQLITLSAVNEMMITKYDIFIL